jgi:tRNA-binding protein
MDDLEAAPVKPTVSYDVFEKLDIPVGTIERVEDVPGADRLVRLIVDLGDHKRRIRAGIKQEREDPTEIEGKQALFVVDLEPREMMGEISGAILFDIRYADGIAPALAVPERPVPNGLRAG